MAPIATELATLRALTFRISSTSTSQLPQHVPAIASSLANCRTLLTSAQASGSKTSSETSVAVHKYRTLLSTLLQDRTIQGRWAAIVLIKATIEVGGWETLQKSLAWVRGLLGILTKPDPPSSKQLCIITITRIFILTRDFPTLVREITTPSLPTFIQSTLQAAATQPSASLLGTILESFNQLLPRHPTIFRSYLRQIQPLLRQTIAPTPSSKLSPEQIPESKLEVNVAVSEAARRLYTQLPCSAPKGATNEEWQESLRKTIVNIHRVGDKVFRAVVEDWKSPARDAAAANGHTLDDEVQDVGVEPMSLPPWSGIFAGMERLVGLMSLVKDHITCPTTAPVNLNIGGLVDLLTRLFSLTIPSAKSQGFQNGIKFNNQVGGEERENLWLILPKVHVAAIDILLALTQRSDASTTALDTIMLDQMVWLFTAEKDISEVRTACYLAVTELLLRSGVTLPKSSVDPLSDIIRRCCEDILPLETSSASSKQSPLQPKANGGQQATANADSFLVATKKSSNHASNFTGLQTAACSLLSVLFTHLRPQHLSDSLRARMDRTAILVGNKDAMMASILNPPPSRKFGKPAASILPFLARSQSGEKDVEALLRPRMPVIYTGTQESDAMEEDEEVDEVEEVLEEIEGDGFVGHELDTILETAAHEGSVDSDVAMTELENTSATAPTTTSIDATVTEADHPADDAMEDFEQTKAVMKRRQEDAAPSSPPKRMKVDEQEESEDLVHFPTQPSLTSPTGPPDTAMSSASRDEELRKKAAVLAAISAVTAVTYMIAKHYEDKDSDDEDGDDEDSDDEDSDDDDSDVDDSDDDDIPPLVMGQDTESESD